MTKSNSHEWLIYNIYNIWVIYRSISLQNIFPSASDEMQPLSCKFCHYSYQCRSANLLGCHDKRSLISSAIVPITKCKSILGWLKTPKAVNSYVSRNLLHFCNNDKIRILRSLLKDKTRQENNWQFLSLQIFRTSKKLNITS